MSKDIFTSLGHAVRQHGDKVARKATGYAVRKGWLDRSMNLRELLAELEAMRADGRLGKEEFKRLKDEAVRRFRQRSSDKPPKK
jgi:uncharacterized protein HemY